ncbi:MAG: FkbM family methyltransferase [Patescibacteria group bacterium]
MNFDTSSYVEWELFFRGYYEKWVIDVMKKLIPQGGVAVDAGANIGTHALIMAKLAGSGGRVLAFDPDPKSIERLTRNIALNNLTNTKVFGLGLFDKPGTLKLFSYSDEMSDQGTASFYKLPKLQERETRAEVKTLDEVLENEQVGRLDLVKIDTRGSDFPIIKGAAKSIDRFRPCMIFEYNRDNWSNSGSEWKDARDFFDSRNYVLYVVSPKGVFVLDKETDGKTSYNILAMPKEKNLKL